MPKGLYTQSACVLLSGSTSLDAIEPLLTEFKIVKRLDTSDQPEMGGPALVIAFRPEVNGYIKVDIRDKKWPDHMGDPKTESMLFGAWVLGNYGPFAFPGNLQRAEQQAWSWKEARSAVERHVAFVHISSSYSFGLPKDGKVIPADYDPLPEIQFVTRIALALLKHPDAVAYFNANGEVLSNESLMRESIAYHEQHQIPPFGLWSNIRILNPNNGWTIMDTVGMGQFDRPDLEACFRQGAFDTGEVSYFLRNCCLYLLKNGEVVKHKDTMNGPSETKWQAFHVQKELCSPPRRLIRWFPLDGSQPPSEMREAEPPKKSFFQRLMGR